MKTYSGRVGSIEAEQFLALSVEGNRLPSPTAIDRYKTDMVNGDWIDDTGEALKFTGGKMIDGRQRCMAVILADKEKPGITIGFTIAEDVPEQAFTVLDTGRSRTGANSIQIASAGSYSGKTAPLVLWHWQYIRGNPIGVRGSSAPVPTRSQLIRHWNTNPDGFEASMKRGYDCQAQKLGPARAYALFHYLLSTQVDHNAAEAFFDRVVSGSDLSIDSPILSFRNRVLSRQGGGVDGRYKKYKAYEILWLLHRTWRAVVNDEKVRIVLPALKEGQRMTNAIFPKLVIPGEQE